MTLCDDNYVAGCHGTVAEQLDEAYYDDRSDADDDLEKGKIKFPKNKLYGRERELGILRRLYCDMMETNNRGDNPEVVDDQDGTVAGGGQRVSFTTSNNDCRVVFLSGYSGVGKSALVKEFTNQIQQGNKTASPVLSFSGKYVQQSGGVAPFSAISEMFGNMVVSLSNQQSLSSSIWNRIQSSDVIGPDKDGSEVLLDVFSSLRPLLDGTCANNTVECRGPLPNEECGGGEKDTNVPSMNAVKESTLELLVAISSSLQRPMIFFLDDLQWADGPSMELLSFLFSETQQMKYLIFICAYRSNEVGAEHPFSKIMAEVKEARGELVANVDLFSLSQEAISQFIADSIGKDEIDDVAELVEVIYPKTMGNIFCVMQALEELIRKNALYYDVMCFEWRWATGTKVELADQVSADVVETIKEKINGLSVGIQSLLSVMAYIPCSVGAPVLKELLMNDEDNVLNESEIASLLKKASEEGMLMWSSESGHYSFAHDRIREASRSYAEEKEDYHDLLLHLANALQRLGDDSEMEWFMYTAVDLLNSLPSEKVNITDLIKLNLKVSKMAKRKGSQEKENILLREAVLLLDRIKWEDYELSLEVYNALIASEYIMGNHNRVTVAVDEVLDHAKSLTDKLSAYLYRVRSQCDVTKDYKSAAREGAKILNMFSFNIPLEPTNLDLVREKMKLKLAFKSRSYSYLATLPVIEDPLFELISYVCRDALFSSQPRLLMMVGYTAVRRAIKKGIDSHFPLILVFLGTLLGKTGKVKTANEIGNVALTLSNVFISSNKAGHSFTRFASYAGIIFYLQSFRSGVDVLLQCYKDLKFAGQFEFALGSMLNYFNAYFAAGLSIGALLESKLLVVEEFCQRVERNSYAATFQIHRQFAINLRQKSELPTVLNGPAFYQETALAEMNDQSRSMTLRDASIYRLQLAFIFKDCECMASMLDTLSGYPFQDQVVARFYIRACFMGLAAFSLVEKKNRMIGNQCLKYFKRMKTLGSINAPPAYFFIMALKNPSKKSFTTAIESCAETSMMHLEAMVRERYAMFLLTRNESELANNHITSAYWLYYDWGAHGKALALAREYPFLANVTRTKAKSNNSSKSGATKRTNVTAASGSYTVRDGLAQKRGVFEYNSTLRHKQFVKK